MVQGGRAVIGKDDPSVKKISNIFSVILMAVLFFFAGGDCAYAHHHHGGPGPRREPDCEVRVVNDSDFDMYIMIDGRNEGKVDKNSSETFKVHRWGELKVEAEVENETAKDWVRLSPDDERGEVTFNNDDFPHLDPAEYKKR